MLSHAGPVSVGEPSGAPQTGDFKLQTRTVSQGSSLCPDLSARTRASGPRATLTQHDVV